MTARKSTQLWFEMRNLFNNEADSNKAAQLTANDLKAS